jgi:hypothetical protein
MENHICIYVPTFCFLTRIWYRKDEMRLGGWWATLWRLFSTLGDLGAPFCHPWGSVVAPGGPFCHPWTTFGRLFVDLEWPWGSIVVSLGSIWAPLGHFGSLSGKRCEKRSQIDLQLNLKMGRFSVHFRYFYYFEGVMAGARRTPVSGYFSCSVFWDSGKRNMELTTVFTVPNAHHIFGSRHSFSEFVVPSGIHFGGCWIVFFCFLESFASSGGVRGGNTFLTPFWVHFLGSGQARGNELSDPNGLARESSNLRSMDSGGYVDMSLYR